MNNVPSVQMRYWKKGPLTTLDSFIVNDEANGISFPQVPSPSGWSGSVRPSMDETGPVSPHGCRPSGSPLCSSSSWVSSPSRSPVDSWWLHTGAGRPPSTPAGSPLPAVSGSDSGSSASEGAGGTFHRPFNL